MIKLKYFFNKLTCFPFVFGFFINMDRNKYNVLLVRTDRAILNNTIKNNSAIAISVTKSMIQINKPRDYPYKKMRPS